MTISNLNSGKLQLLQENRINLHLKENIIDCLRSGGENEGDVSKVHQGYVSFTAVSTTPKTAQ